MRIKLTPMNLTPHYEKPQAASHTAYKIPVGFLEVYGVVVSKPASVLSQALDQWVAALIAGSSEEVMADPRLAGYQALHSMIGKTGRQWVPSPESLFKMLFKRGAWRSLGSIIDCYSLVSLQTRVSIGAHDLSRLVLPVELVQMRGGERVQLIGDDSPTVVSAGEYCYQDAAGVLLGRLEIRQAAHSRVKDATRDVLFIIQGHATLGAESIVATVDTLLRALGEYCGTWSRARLTLSD